MTGGFAEDMTVQNGAIMPNPLRSIVTCAALDRLEADQLEVRAHTAVHRHGRREAHLVEPVVDRHAHAAEFERRIGQQRQQGKREEAVRDGAAERAGGSTHRVDVDPLHVAGGARELVDALLRDADPLARADHLAELAAELFQQKPSASCFHPVEVLFLQNRGFRYESQQRKLSV